MIEATLVASRNKPGCSKTVGRVCGVISQVHQGKEPYAGLVEAVADRLAPPWWRVIIWQQSLPFEQDQDHLGWAKRKDRRSANAQ